MMYEFYIDYIPEPDKPGIVIETVPEGDDDLTDDDNDDSSHNDEHLSRSIIQTPGLLPGKCVVLYNFYHRTRSISFFTNDN